MILCLIPLLLIFIRQQLAVYAPGYLFTAISRVILLIIFNTKKLKKHSLIGIYIFFFIFFCLAFFLSIGNPEKNQAATSLLFFCVMPIIILDKPWKLTVISFILYVIHTYFAFAVKVFEFCSTDSINALISFVLGIAGGKETTLSRLQSFDAYRRLIIEKDTDVLTGLNNRRKLFEQITNIELKKETPPTGVMMIDIDHFKHLNDSYGHETGDKCLSCFGNLLKSFSKSHNLDFFRYGGEEFVCFAHVSSEDELYNIATYICKESHKIKVCPRKFTVSIGIVFCNDNKNKNYENWITLADEAVYQAKKSGRNKVVIYNF